METYESAQIFLKDYTIHDKAIGEGNFGSCQLIQHKLTKQMLILKRSGHRESYNEKAWGYIK